MKKLFGIAAASLIVIACAAVGVVGTDRLVAMVDAQGTGSGGSSRQGASVRVTTATPESRTFRDAFRTVGTLRPARSIELRPLSEGRVTEVAVASGERVEAGQLLFALDDRAQQAALDDARATLEEARAELERTRELAGENVVADASLQSVRATFLRAQAAAAAAQAELEDRRVSAPFSGVLGLIDLDEGARVDLDTVVTTLDDISSIEAQFAVPERYFARASAGQDVLLDGAIHDDRTFSGEVTVKAPRIDPASRSFTLRVRVDNDDRALTGGMFMNATLVFEAYEALSVPDDAIISEGDATYVYVVRDGEAVRTPVRLGRRDGGRTEIAEGLSSGEAVVVSGYDRLSDGDPVDVAEQDASEEALN